MVLIKNFGLNFNNIKMKKDDEEEEEAKKYTKNLSIN